MTWTLLPSYLLLAGAMASAQPISIGLTGGIPISRYKADYPNTLNAQAYSAFDRLTNKPYVVGALVNTRVYEGLFVEGGVLYSRLHEDFSQFIVQYSGLDIKVGQVFSASAPVWQFPLLARYSFARHSPWAPFVKVGATLRHVGDFQGQQYFLDPLRRPTPTTSLQYSTDKALDTAVTAGAGLQWRIGALAIEPEVRYLHWMSDYYQPAQDQALAMLTIRFPAGR